MRKKLLSLLRFRVILGIMGILCIPLLGSTLYQLYGTSEQMRNLEHRQAVITYLAENFSIISQKLILISQSGAYNYLGNDTFEQKRFKDTVNGRVQRFGYVSYAANDTLPFEEVLDAIAAKGQIRDQLTSVHEQIMRLASTALRALDQERLFNRNSMGVSSAEEIQLSITTDTQFVHGAQRLQQELERLQQYLTQNAQIEQDRLQSRIFSLLVFVCVLITAVGITFVFINKDTGLLRDNKDEKKLVMGAVLTLIVGVVTPLCMMYMDARSYTQEGVAKYQMLVARQVHYAVESQFTLLLKRANMLASLSSLRAFLAASSHEREPLLEEWEKVLDSFVATYQDVQDVTLFDASGEMLYHHALVGDEFAPRVIPQDDWLRLQKGTSVVTLVRGLQSQERDLLILAPVTVAGGHKLIGAVGLALDKTSDYAHWKDAFAQNKQLDIYVLAADGEVILSTRERKGLATATTPTQVINIVRGGETGVHHFTDDAGNELVGSFVPLKQIGLNLAVVRSSDISMRQLDTMLFWAIAWGMVAILLSGVAAAQIFRHVRGSLKVVNSTLDNLVSNAGAHIFKVDLEQHTFIYGANFHRDMHFPGPPEAGSMPISQIMGMLHPDDAEIVRGLLDMVSGKTLPLLDIRTKDGKGEWRWMRIQAHPDLIVHNKLVRVFGICIETTAQRVLEESLAEQRELTEQLRKSNEQMEAIIEAAELYWFDLDFVTGTFTHNGQWVKTWGYPGPAEPGLQPIEYILERSTPKTQAVFKKTMTNKKVGDIFCLELEHVHPTTGEHLWGRNVGQVLAVDEKGTVLHCSGVGLNLTPQRQAERAKIDAENARKKAEDSEAALREQTNKLTLANARMQDIITAADMFTYSLDMLTGRFSHSEQWCTFWKYPGPAEAGYKDLSFVVERMHPDSMRNFNETMKQLKLDDSFSVDLEVTVCTGETRWGRQVGRVDKVDSNGHPTQISGTGYDITALKTVEKTARALQDLSSELKAANDRMDAMVEAGGMYTFDMDITSDIFVHNAQWCRFWGYPGAVEPGTKSIDVVLDRLSASSRKQFERALAQAKLGETLSMELEINTYNNEIRWCRQVGRVEAVDVNGRVSRFIGTGFDVTIEKRQQVSEEEYKVKLENMVASRTVELEESRNQAEAASRAKTIFLSTVSHEIRTPMNAIMGFIHIFDRDNLTDEQQSQLDKIRLSAEALLGVINDVLDISKIESGKLELEVRPFQILPTLDSVHSIVELTAVGKGLELNVEVAPNVPMVVVGDSQRIRQVLLNLLNNAVKFTDKGHVSLEVSLRTEQQPDLPYVTDTTHELPLNSDGTITLGFRVEDTGIGITTEQIKRIFQPFMQADSSVTRKYGGTGLGLSISRQLVELMGGRVQVSSTPGRGSVFDVTIRVNVVAPERCDADAAAHAAPDSTTNVAAYDATLLQDKRILVVEDNEINQEIAQALLMEYPVHINMVFNGQQALDIVREQQFDCIFMDMQMPIMGGIEATQRLRALGEDRAFAWLKTVPIVAMTANALSEDRERCLAAGMNDHIGKPIAPELLRNCLITWIK